MISVWKLVRLELTVPEMKTVSHVSQEFTIGGIKKRHFDQYDVSRPVTKLDPLSKCPPSTEITPGNWPQNMVNWDFVY